MTRHTDGVPYSRAATRVALVLMLAGIVAFSLSCSGDKKPGSGDGGSNGGGSGGDGIGVASLPKPVKVDLPQGQASLGPNDEDTVKAITDAFTKAGLNLSGIELSVYPVADAHESLLVMDMDTTKLAESDDEAYTAAPAALFDLPAVKAANITRVVINMPGKDAQGNYVLTVVAKLEYFRLLNDPASEDLSEEEGEKKFRELVRLEIVR